jgi:ElaB/YqjD/DUF883 family membrane-anchored ribosome-binding protein
MPNTISDTNSSNPASDHKSAASEAKDSLRQAKDSASALASTTAARVEDKLEQVKEQGQQLLHDASEKAGRAYRSASDYAHQAADGVRHQAHAAGQYAQRAGGESLSFMSTHALPLSMIGLGVGWLAVSMRAHSRRRYTYVDQVDRQTMPTLRGKYREPLAGDYAEPVREQRASDHRAAYGEPQVSDGTSTSKKLIGVRTLDARSSSTHESESDLPRSY